MYSRQFLEVYLYQLHPVNNHMTAASFSFQCKILLLGKIHCMQASEANTRHGLFKEILVVFSFFPFKKLSSLHSLIGFAFEVSCFLINCYCGDGF